MAERSEAKNAKRSFASKIKNGNILTGGGKLKWTTYWSLSPQGLSLHEISHRIGGKAEHNAKNTVFSVISRNFLFKISLMNSYLRGKKVNFCFR